MFLLLAIFLASTGLVLAEERLLGPDKRETSFNAFMGNAQVIIRSLDSTDKAVMPTVVFLQLNNGKETSITLDNVK